MFLLRSTLSYILPLSLCDFVVLVENINKYHVDKINVFFCFQLSTIGRCEYEKTCSLLVQLFDESAQRYGELLSSVQNIQVAVQEGMSSATLSFLY